MRYILFFLLALITLVLQSTIFVHLSIGGVKPDLLLIWVIFFGLIKGKQKGAAFGFGMGLVEDLLTGRFIGLNALSKMIIGYFMGVMEGKVYKENFLAPGLAVIAGSLANGVITLLLYKMVGFAGSFNYYFYSTVLPMVIYNLGIAPLLYLKFYRAVTVGALSPPRS